MDTAKEYIVEVVETAKKMEAAVEGTDVQTVFNACIVIMSWALMPQSQEIRKEAIERVIGVLEGRNPPPSPPLKVN